ncbi:MULTISPECIES: hypothetical protein [unclassified Streptomyces]|uniref:hypothetical protein n=1 Tax=unclassified Streptomyces TaxID=2593676 RepID=UPI0029ABB5B4|nr:hypothetical protein [Streptomyces sp. DK15]MDX2391659.1 hypothetical protein [Streptomyces sp. DK15]
MIPRTKPVRVAAAVLLALGASLFTGCGTATEQEGAREVSVSGDGGDDLSAVTAHCDGRGPGAASVTPDGSGEGPADPEARKYAENHAYRQQAGLGDEAKCRGDAHAERIRKALADAEAGATGAGGPGGPRNPAELTALLRGLGYPVAGGDVYASGGSAGPGGPGLGFALWIPGTGPCLSGALGTPARVEAHGVYMEGGCREPKGGH